MKRYLMIITAALTLIFSCFYGVAQEANRPMLVFCKDGSIHSFKSGELDRIQLSKFDKDSIEQTDFVSQIFIKKDGSHQIFSIAEIDSVAFGVRNIIEKKNSIRRLSDEEAEAIARYDGEKIYYKSDVQHTLMVKPGESVYYDRMTETLPYGLLAKALQTAIVDGMQVVYVEELKPADVFSRYVYTGEGEEVPGILHKPSKLQDVEASPKLFSLELPKGTFKGCTIDGNVQLLIGVDAEDAVFDVLHDYYHAVFKFYIKPQITVGLHSENSVEANFVSDKKIPLTFRYAGGLLTANLELSGFVDFLADIGFEYELLYENSFRVEWTRKNGNNTFTNLNLSGNKSMKTEQKAEAHLKGEIFVGPFVDLSLNALYDRIGAGIELKSGALIEGELSAGAIQELSEEFNQETYAKGQLSIGLKAEGEPYVYRLEHWAWGDRIKTPLNVKPSVKWELGKLNLFPEFNSRSVIASQTGDLILQPDRQLAVDVATYTETPIEYPLTMGYELVDTETKEVIAEIEPKNKIEPYSSEIQNYYEEIPLERALTEDEMKRAAVYPTFNYSGFKIKGRPTNVAVNHGISPRMASFSGNGSYFIYGAQPVQQVETEETVYIVGNNMPLHMQPEDKYRKRTATTIEFVNLGGGSGGSGASQSVNTSLIGTWHGTLLNSEVTLTFEDDNRGSCNDQPFSYTVNSPLIGGISILFDNESTMSLRVVGLSDNKLSVMTKNSNEIFELIK